MNNETTRSELVSRNGLACCGFSLMLVTGCLNRCFVSAWGSGCSITGAWLRAADARATLVPPVIIPAGCLDHP